jgi:nitrogen regulatory protein PII
MSRARLKLVTIVAEPILEERLVEELHRLGARGHTITAARGAGTRGLHAADPPGESVRIEVLVGDEVAGRILDHVAGHYFNQYSLVAFVHDVEVVRAGKYV